jgi:hypothetical protein
MADELDCSKHQERRVVMLASLTNPGAVEIASFIGALFFLAAGYNQVMKAIDRARDRKQPQEISPQPLQVAMVAEFVRKDEHHRQHSENVQAISDVRREVEGLREDRRRDQEVAAKSRKSLYEKIDEAKDSMAESTESVRKELSEKTEDVRKELSDKIDNVPDRVIAILKNTGALE